MRISTDRLPDSFLVLGLMSGTSLDGLDLALVRFSPADSGGIRYEMVDKGHFEYPASISRQLDEAMTYDKARLRTLENAYSEILVRAIRRFLIDEGEHPDIIASHGHTVFHQPDEGITLQIGDGNYISRELGIPVVYDFRTQDVLLGGQGAPLVPIGDALLFSAYDYCLNLGGISNISYQINDQRIAYDISPCNLLLNHFAQKAGVPFDKGGEMAASGQVIAPLLERWNALDFYRQAPPKSLGREWVEQHFYDGDYKGYPIADLLRTGVEHISLQIGRAMEGSNTNVLITGGGAYNDFLVERIRKHTEAEVILPAAELIEYKEALIFALLGYLRWHGIDNVLASVTGAKHNHCAGRIARPDESSTKNDE